MLRYTLLVGSCKRYTCSLAAPPLLLLLLLPSCAEGLRVMTMFDMAW